MILAFYLLKSTLAMCILLAFYRLFLEQEKMHHFNRIYLLSAVVLSIILPFLPTGFVFDSIDIPAVVVVSSAQNVGVVQISNESPAESLTTLLDIGIFLYFFGLAFFSLIYSRNVFQLIHKAKTSPKKAFKSAQIVFLEEPISPFTFLKYIFINREQYEKNKIDQHLLAHELTHALEKHSMDILFIELMITIFWFNPVLRMYKTAIQLNHEFLADDSVIDKYKEVKTYQYLLLDTIQNNNKIYLASNINFHLTQKRLKMMTKKSTSTRKNVLIFSMVPIVLGLLLCLGNPAISQQQTIQNMDRNPANIGEIQGDPQSAKDRYFEQAIIHYATEDGKTKVISYKSLDEAMKAKMPPPPPVPPAPPGMSQEKMKNEPLPKGTVVFLTEDGSIFIGGKKDGVEAVPPPPPPKPPKSVKNVKPPAPPSPPVAPVSPKISNHLEAAIAPEMPIPPPPPNINDLAKEGAIFYIDGKEVSAKKAKKMWNDNDDNAKSIHVKVGNDGKKSVYLTKS